MKIRSGEAKWFAQIPKKFIHGQASGLASNEVLTSSQVSPCSYLLAVKLSSPHLRLASQKLEEKKERRVPEDRGKQPEALGWDVAIFIVFLEGEQGRELACANRQVRE